MQDLRLLSLASGRSGAVRCLVDWASIGLELDLMLPSPNLPQLSGPHVLEFVQYVQDFRAEVSVLGSDMNIFFPGVRIHPKQFGLVEFFPDLCLRGTSGRLDSSFIRTVVASCGPMAHVRRGLRD